MNPTVDFMTVSLKDGTVIASGYPVAWKENASCKDISEPMPVFSFDNIRFFHRCGNARYTVSRTQAPEKKDIVKYIPRDDFKEVKWAEAAFNPDADVFVEHSMDELDPEIVPLVTALNIIPGVRTSGSCSGHGKHPAWVTSEFKGDEGSMGLFLLMNILQSAPLTFSSRFNINLSRKGGTHTADKDKRFCTVELITKDRGEDAWGATRALADYIQELARTGLFDKSRNDCTFDTNMKHYKVILW